MLCKQANGAPAAVVPFPCENKVVCKPSKPSIPVLQHTTLF